MKGEGLEKINTKGLQNASKSLYVRDSEPNCTDPPSPEDVIVCNQPPPSTQPEQHSLAQNKPDN